jgi:tetratricopeptide (TPR) repeat protein
MNSLFLVNPFERQALKDDKMLSGKDHLEHLTQIRKIFNNSTYNSNTKSILIRGDRGTGKTSLLKILQNDALKYKLVPVHLFVTESNSSSTNVFLNAIYNSLFNVCKEQGVLIKEIDVTEKLAVTGVVENSEFLAFEVCNKLFVNRRSANIDIHVFAEDVLKDFKLIISELKRSHRANSELDNLKLTFFIDEAHLFFGNKEILNIIRHVIQEEIGVVFVLVSQHPCDDSVLNEVFDSVSRAFQVYQLGYFKTYREVKEFLQKSLEAVGWKERDLRIYIKNIEKLSIDLLLLTGGKPEFVNRIAAEMFAKVMNGEESKIKLNPRLLNKIADDLEMQTTSNLARDGKSFNKSRAEGILKMDSIDLNWFRFLVCSIQKATPRDIYNLFRFLGVGRYNNLNDFRSFINFLSQKQILKFDNEQSFRLNQSVGYNYPTSDEFDILNSQYEYLGVDSEKFWILLNIGSRKLKFLSNNPVETLKSEIFDLAGFGGQTRLGLQTHESIGVIEKEYGFLGFLDCSLKQYLIDIKTGNRDINEIDPQVLLFILNILRDIKSVVLIFRFSFHYLNKVHNEISYKFEISNYSSSKMELECLKHRFQIEDIDINFEFEEINRLELLSYDDFIDIILSSDNKDASMVLLKDVINDSTRLYQNNDSSENNTNILRRLDITYRAIEAGHEVDEEILNNTGYMFYNLGEFAKAEICLKIIVDRLNRGVYSKFGDEDKRGSMFLGVYNYGILLTNEKSYKKALDCFERALEISESINMTSISCLNYLELNNEDEIIISEKKSKVDAVSLIENNILLLAEV